MNIKAKIYCDGTDHDAGHIDIKEFLETELKARKLLEKYKNSTLSTDEKKSKKKIITEDLKTKRSEKIKAEARTESIDITDTDVKNILKPFCDIENDDSDYILNVFQKSHVVEDVWRYTISVCNNNIRVLPIIKSNKINSYFSDRPAVDAIGTKIILLVLESPHTSEYEDKPQSSNELKPKAPAQGKDPGDAGGAIEKYLKIVLRQANLANGFYSLVISNPIPYQCSLDCIVGEALNKNIRDAVWQAIWKTMNGENHVIQDNFIARYATYQPVCTINCCTKLLTDFVSGLLIKNNIDNLYITYHPARNWCSEQYNLKVHKV